MKPTADRPNAFDRNELARAACVYVHPRDVKFQDVDAAGVVFFARIFEYFHDAYLAFMEARGLPHAAVLREGKWGAPIRRAEADFLSPLRFGDAVDVGLVRAHFDGSKLQVGYRVGLRGGSAVAVGITHHVIVNFPGFSRVTPPPELRAVFESLEG